jgi:hypothetical protein
MTPLGVTPLPSRVGVPLTLFTIAGLVVGAVIGAAIAGASFLPLFIGGMVGYLLCWLLAVAWYRRRATRP